MGGKLEECGCSLSPAQPRYGEGDWLQPQDPLGRWRVLQRFWPRRGTLPRRGEADQRSLTVLPNGPSSLAEMLLGLGKTTRPLTLSYTTIGQSRAVEDSSHLGVLKSSSFSSSSRSCAVCLIGFEWI